ncbi:MAG TPA: methionine--tRNA ligase [Vicinamibacterales bacterium]|nr:methionine--tRNA ligase [Vicinamibacterales bacterium]
MAARHLITSALPYINGVKHLGNLIGSMLPADVYARYLRARGRQVLLLCATDEHGTPAELAALEAGQDVAEFCRLQHQIQADLARRFHLSFDHFGRSSSPQNHELTKYFARRLEEHGLIEERTTRQIYSRADGRFLPDRYVVGTCPHCGFDGARGDQCENCTRVLDPVDLLSPRSSISGSADVEIRESRHLFFKLPALAPELRTWIESKTDWPSVTVSIGLKWLDEGLQDRGITRDLRWGVPVDRPGFEDKVFYVWFDAPIEYIGVTKEWADLDPARDWRSWWFDADDVAYTQFMAKDNVPFHTIMFPATLIGTREPWKLPDFIKAFNWLTYDGGKFSTSRHRGVFMSDALELLPADYWRYYLLANAPESDDADFTWTLFAAVVNKDLVGVFGNFVNRVLKFTASKFDGQVPAGGEAGPREAALFAELDGRIAAYQAHLEALSFRKALIELRAIWAAGNVYLADLEPWKLVESDRARAAAIVRTALNLVRLFAILSAPAVPEASGRVLDALEASPDERRWPADVRTETQMLRPGRHILPIDLLFRRITEDETAMWTARFAGQSSSPVASAN